MCGSDNQVKPIGIIRKSPNEELERVGILTKLASEGVTSRRFATAVSELSSLVEKGSSAKARDYAIWGLMNTLLENPECVNDVSIRVIVRAIGDRDEAVSTTAETAALVLAKDFVGRAFPILLDEIRDADEETSEKILSTVRTLCQLATPKERDKLDAMVKKHRVVANGRERPMGKLIEFPKKMPVRVLKRVA